MAYRMFSFEIDPKDIPPYDVKGLRNVPAVMKDVKRAYRQRKRSDLHLTEFLRVSQAVVQSINRDFADSKRVDEKTVRALFNDGTFEYAFDALHEPGFFEESQASSSTMMLGILFSPVALVDELEIVDLAERIVNKLTPEFWEWIWGLRHMTLAHPLRHVFKTLSHLTGAYVRLCQLLGKERLTAAVQTRVVQWTFFAWLKLSSDSSEDCALTGRDALRNWGIFLEVKDALPEHNDFVTPESKFYIDILETYGAEEIYNRLVFDYKDPGALAYSYKSLNQYYQPSISKLLWNLGDFPETSDHVVSSGILTQLVRRIEDYSHPHRHHRDYNNVIVVWSDCVKNFARNMDSSYIFLPEDFASYLAHGINAYALELYETQEQRKTHMERVMTLFKYLESFSTLGDEAGYIHYMDGLYDLSDTLVAAIHRNVQSYFAKNRASILEEEAPSIGSRWLSLTYKFHCMTGVDIGYARSVYNDKREWLCDWQRCRHNWDPVTDKRLKLCRGCGIARYCGSDCQRLDWKAGRHKTMCGKRIKDH